MIYKTAKKLVRRRSASESIESTRLSDKEQVPRSISRPRKTGSQRDKVLVVDDDTFFAAQMVRALSLDGFSAYAAHGVEEAKRRIARLKPNLVVTDLMIPAPVNEIDPTYYSSAEAGEHLALWILDKFPNTKVIGMSFWGNSVTGKFFSERCSGFIEKGSIGMENIGPRLRFLMDPGLRLRSLRTFIVHGRDEVAKLELKNFIQNKLEMPEPIVLHEQPNNGLTLIEKFEKYADITDVVFVLLTPDDEGGLLGSTEQRRPRARQNVIFEAGYFVGRFGRNSGKVIILHKSTAEVPSDLFGVVYIDITGGINSAGENIRMEMQRIASI